MSLVAVYVLKTAAPCSMFLTWVFWLAGAAAITDTLGGGLNCGCVVFAIFPHVRRSNRDMTSRDAVTYCGQLNALEAFAWVELYVPFRKS